MLAARLSPPPNSSSTPHGTPAVSSQRIANTPRFTSTGIMNSSSAPVMAMLVSETSGTTRATMGWKIQPSAVSAKTIATVHSPRDMGPCAAFSLAIMPATPGSSSVPSLNMTRVSTT